MNSDGSGYFANGALSFDTEGRLYNDGYDKALIYDFYGLATPTQGAKITINLPEVLNGYSKKFIIPFDVYTGPGDSPTFTLNLHPNDAAYSKVVYVEDFIQANQAGSDYITPIVKQRASDVSTVVIKPYIHGAGFIEFVGVRWKAVGSNVSWYIHCKKYADKLF